MCQNMVVFNKTSVFTGAEPVDRVAVQNPALNNKQFFIYFNQYALFDNHVTDEIRQTRRCRN